MNLTTLMAEATPPLPEVRLRGGVVVRPRPLTLRETAAVREALPRPLPPRVKDPARGSAALTIPDENDPGYRRECQTHYYKILVAEAAIAIGWEPHGLGAFDAEAPGEARTAWIAQASGEIAGAITEPELAAINEALARADRELSAAARKGLIVALGEDAAVAAAPDEDPLPDNYGQTNAYAMLRVCERFGQNPVTLLADLGPADRAMLLQYDRARRQEEDRRDAVFVKAGAAARV